MNIHEYRTLLANRGALRQLLQDLPNDEVIGRHSLETHLQEVEKELKIYQGYSPKLISALLMFRGGPVEGNQSIQANFGSQVIKKFTTAVTTVGASLRSPLRHNGRVPYSQDYQMSITRLVQGSFGFELEAKLTQPLLYGETTPLEQALERFREILEGSVATREKLEETISENDPRALKSVYEFLKTIDDHQATCSLEMSGKIFRFRNVHQVRRSKERLHLAHVQEGEVTLVGWFRGFLPNELKAALDTTGLHGVSEAVSLRVFPEVAEAVDINALLGRPVQVTLLTRRIGRGPLRYTAVIQCTELDHRES